LREDVRTVGRKRRFFEFRGGVPCLDFVNTLAWRLTDCPVEYLGHYGDLLVWGRQAGLLAPEETEALSERVAADPGGARAVVARAIALREAVHGALSAAIVGEPPDRGALTVLNRELSGALARLRLVEASGGSYAWAWARVDGSRELELDLPLWPVARSAADLLTSPKLGRVKVCEGRGCGWMFLDESRNGSRRWCDSRDCGNRERVRKHLARKKGTPRS
jgi:predicted RNA-binding Zn ribbon-like protein